MLKSNFWFGIALALVTLASLLIASPVTNFTVPRNWLFETAGSIAFGLPLIISISGLSALHQYCYEWPNGKSVRKAIYFSLAHGGIAGAVVVLFFSYLVLFTPYNVKHVRGLIMFSALFFLYICLGSAYAWFKLNDRAP